MSAIDSTIVETRPTSETRRGSDYSALLARMRQEGLLDRRLAHYWVRMAINGVLMAAGWTAFVLIGDSWWQLAVAAFLALMFTQTGFLGHDAGHRQIFKSRRANQIAGLVHGNIGIGLAFGWWVDKHHRHHAHPNQEGLDPDISGDAIVFTASQTRGRRGIGRWFARYQAHLFFPLLLLEGISLHVASVRAVAQPSYRERGREALLLGVHAAAYLTVVFLVLPPVMAVAFIAVQQGLFGLYLGMSFAPNHKGMPILAADDDSDFLRRQVLTSRNVRGGWFVDFMLGGLNYQIEHHLFPSMPRPSLKRAQPIVRQHCLELGLPYLETTAVESYRQALQHLYTVGRADDIAAAPEPRMATVRVGERNS